MRHTTSRWRCAVAAVGAVAVLTACSGDDGTGVQPILPSDDPAEAEDTDDADAAGDEPAEDDPFAIPDEITVEYVQVVVDEILARSSEAERDALDQAPLDGTPDELIASIRAHHSADESVAYLAELEVLLADPEAAQARLESGRDPRWTVTEIAHEEAGCVIIDFDYREGAAAESGRQVLHVKSDARDPEGRNPTPWVLDRGGPLGIGVFDDLSDLLPRCREVEG